MKHFTFHQISGLLLIFFVSYCAPKQDYDSLESVVVEETALTSWNDGPSKQKIIQFVEKTTDSSSPDFVPESKRIAVFDNDGTLWAENPVYFQLFYAIDFIKKHSPGHPEWSANPTLKAILEDDLQTALEGGEKALAEIVMVSHAGMTEDQFTSSVRDWIKTSKHPQTGKAFNQMIYYPMVELMEYLRESGYKTFIVSGGGIDFIRAWAEETYGIPPYQVVGSSLKAEYTEVDGKNQIVKLPELNFYDDKAGKPVGIHQHIGERPIMAFGNSDGDYEMLEYTTQSPGPRLGVYIHHTDSIREYAYDRNSLVGQLVRGLDNAESNGWLLVDMAKDWKIVYPNP
ncbi:HAD family hydrolase [Algoriphagus zhangzhouensis]|uniref:phosphoserine phosphatase n=1 Tax=Algoriphagus zhangzhouensis TaxID=1073327 RepID=A0A1M7ZHM1_9BACT|nr:HAD family hydrolase [Algoriphagus zhangzhouensis]TDY44200.1 phosphoserine phosphatase [Algoriphagus zhangzhouensis]SHO64373.1 Phosphoserine phosphatase [Algoriphagus zhangzhouensis]